MSAFTVPVVDDSVVEAMAYRMWLSDMEADPMFYVSSYQAAKDDCRRRALVAVDVLAGRLP